MVHHLTEFLKFVFSFQAYLILDIVGQSRKSPGHQGSDYAIDQNHSRCEHQLIGTVWLIIVDPDPDLKRSFKKHASLVEAIHSAILLVIFRHS